MSTDYKKIFGQKDIILTNTDRDRIGSEVESVKYMSEYFNKKQRFIPPVDFSKPKYFARFGSAEKYFTDAVDRIYKTYPYDGSLKERIQWELSSSYLDLDVFENGYPRTNGYIIFSAEGWGTQADSVNGYGAPATASYEYISIKGGPHTSNRSAGKDIQDASGDYENGYANIWDPSKNRESNLKIGGTAGNTVEFWMKKSEFVKTLTGREVVFDLYTSEYISSSDNYGRLTVEMTGTTSGNPFAITYMSGTSGFSSKSFLNSSITTGSVADGEWHHYAFTIKNAGNDAKIKFYFDGNCDDERTISNSSINYVSGNLNATIGSLATTPSGTAPAAPTLGWGKFSGSLDEFRFWKTERTSQQIGRQHIEPVGGGTNTDDANTTLGVYYKFNEGITLTSSTDKAILDYSGRVSNGSFEGYNSSARSTNSAMVESGKVSNEFKDPILYSFHPDVVSYRNTKKLEGRDYDYSNNASIYHSLPTWIIEEDEAKEYSALRNLTQIVGSYFDTLASQIESIPKLKHKNYLSASFKPYPFSDRLLESVGFSYFPELFSDATALQHFRNRDDVSLFKQKLYDVKNRIYQNIYNNIIYIYKTKGTEKSFRNLIRCFGLDSEIYKINLYGNHVTHQLKDNYESIAEFKKYANFSLATTQDATIFPFSSSTNPNSTSFISASQAQGLEVTGGLAFTMETEVVFPIRHSLADSNTTVQSDSGSSKAFRAYSPFKSASLFGVHQIGAADGSTVENNLTWAPTDYANFQVFAVRDEEHSKRCLFLLTGTAASVIPELSSDYFEGVFDDARWTFSVAIKPTKYPETTLPSGSLSSSWDVEFYGIEKVLDTTRNEFFVTSSIDRASGARFIRNPKSVYIGAHRTNFSGALIEKSDGNISSTKVWMTHIPTGTIKQHAQDTKNYGPPNPYRSAYLYQTTMSGTRVPEIHTLALNWTFDTLSASDSNGEFVGQDFSSGSVSLQNRYNWIGNIIGKQYLPKGYSFPTDSSSSINRKYIYSAKKQLPEMINSSDMVNVLDDDDIFFNAGDLMRPANYYMYIEKSMYQSISEEMIRIFSSIKDFNNLIGEPVNKYRAKYKHMEKLRQIFFERVGNTPDLDKYIDFYKWVDQTLDVLLGYLVPASADLSDQYGSNIRTLVESHVLERNKYKWQFPTLEDKTPVFEGTVLGINELTYNWKFGHSGSDQDQKCRWWKERAERTDALSSGDTNVDNDKQTILDSINNETNASDYTLYDNANSTAYSGSTYAIRRLAKPYKFDVRDTRAIKGGINFHPNKKVTYYKETMKRFEPNEVEPYIIVETYNLPGCADDLSGSNKVIKFPLDANNASFNLDTFNRAPGSLLAPFNIISSSVGPQTGLNDLRSDATLTNIHHDVYGPDYEHPMQGPFTEKHIGGNQHRHHPVNIGSDGHPNRGEAWSIDQEGGALTDNGVTLINPLISQADGVGLLNPDANLPRAVFFREPMAKRPVNIRNIQQTTASNLTNIGNYMKDYEIVMTTGRSINNRYFVKNEGVSGSASNVYAVQGVLDYNLPGGAQSAVDRSEVVKNGLTSSVRNDYIIVNRFSAPGDPATMGLGFLDIESQEYSVYNALPWRNLIVRESLHELFIDHTKQFGFFSDAQNSASYQEAGEPYPGTSGSVSTTSYHGSASFHKVNRNTRNVIKFDGSNSDVYTTGAVYDNWYVQHQIPQTDLQYAWITSSVITGYTGSAYYGFEKPDYSNAGQASTDIIFISQSQIENQHGINVDFAGLNTIIVDPVLSGTNTLSSSEGFYGYSNNTIGGVDPSQTLNGLNLHRNGPYEWASWQQTRGYQNPIIRVHKKENRHSFAKNISIPWTETAGFYGGFYAWSNHGGKSRDILVSQIEPPVTSKYKPIIHDLQIKTSWGPDPASANIIVRHAYGNEQNNFPQKVSGAMDLNKETFISVRAGQSSYSLSPRSKTLIYTSLYNFFKNPSPANAMKRLNSLEVKETIYPREHYTYLKSTRQRDNFANSFWRDERNNRETVSPDSGSSSQGAAVSQSMWPLDARSKIDQAPLTSSYGLEGELQNGYNLFFSAADIDSTLRTPFAAASYNRRIPEKTHTGIFFAGDTLWEAGDQAGVNPFYNDYDSYVEDLKRIGKDYGIVPEFRISEQMEYIWNSSNPDFNSPPYNPGYLSLTGSTVSSSNDETFYTVYTYSDFMKYFTVVQRDYSPELGIVPTELTLECEALIKFLPYDGFYPAQRTVQLAELFSQSYAPSTTLAGDGANFRTMVAPFFSPGILYNSIKSGIAVDYPVATGSLGHNLFITGSDHNSTQDRPGDARLSGAFDFRIPFESLLNPLDTSTGLTQIIDTEPHPSASLDSTASFGGEDAPLYRYAMNNFLAEVPSFFLENGGLSTLQSISDTNTIEVKANSDYKMRIVCYNGNHEKLEAMTNENFQTGYERIRQTASFIYNTPAGTMYNRTFDTGSGTGYKMRHVGENDRTLSYGSSFGPPCDAPYRDVTTLLSESSFEPFTPPYYNGYSHIELTFRTAQEGKMEMADIVSSITPSQTSLYREATRESGSTTGEGTSAGRNAMSLTASLNYLQVVSTPNPETGEPAAGGDRWVIQPKWECPILDFENSNVTLPVSGSGSVAKGMWHQYSSTIPKGRSATWLSIQDVPDHDKDLSLRNLLGYNNNNSSVQLGRIAHKGRTIREAIVAIPFLYNPQSDDPDNKDYFKIHPMTIWWARRLIVLQDPTATKFAKSVANSELQSLTTTEDIELSQLKPSQSVIDMVAAMQRYVIPPQFDFLSGFEKTMYPGYPNNHPFAMFLFEFEVTLTQNDLLNIWQNLPPNDDSTFFDNSIGHTSLSRAVTKRVTAPFNWPDSNPGLNLLKRKDISIDDKNANTKTWKGFDLLNERPGEGTHLKDPPDKHTGAIPNVRDESNLPFPSNIQWIVFKVKQKAKTDYYGLTAKDESGKSAYVESGVPSFNPGIPYYSYNWPYDFFSLVELVKLNTAYKLEPNPVNPIEFIPPDPDMSKVEVDSGGTGDGGGDDPGSAPPEPGAPGAGSGQPSQPAFRKLDTGATTATGIGPGGQAGTGMNPGSQGGGGFGEWGP